MKSYKILAITEEGYDTGFRLAGCDVEMVENEKDVVLILQKYIDEKIYGIIIVDADLFYKIEEKKRRIFEESLLPSIVPLNLKIKGKRDAGEYLKEVVRRVLGYSIRIKE
ncbi:MAG: V-type ATP synthase subunit F [candidate division WOR-3 bacterium]|uniref:V-type ATP synthase subunit F n=1 Tax=candidate division WOR-3 bacterium TaxID=2052148 RepID=A0A7V3ZT74_UNCW3